jgi:type VI secretion system protein
MSREQTLLERIRVCNERRRSRYEPSATENLDAVMESVRNHLARLLNARHGMSEGMPDYGLPALTDLTIGSADYLESVKEAIRVAIEKYEPRLRRVRVSQVGDKEDKKRTLSFRIDAVLVSQSGENRVWYQTEVSGNGEYEVSD